jgi:hypothetical protein
MERKYGGGPRFTSSRGRDETEETHAQRSCAHRARRAMAAEEALLV